MTMPGSPHYEHNHDEWFAPECDADNDDVSANTVRGVLGSR